MNKLENRSVRLLFLFLAITSLGSLFSSLATFLSLEQKFGSQQTVAFALSAKTVAMLVTSYIAPVILNLLAEKRSLILSQISGLVSIALLLVGFNYSSQACAILGICTSGFTLALMNIAFVSELSYAVRDQEDFRKQSGKRTMLIGFLFLAAALLVPITLQYVSLNSIFCFDGITFVASMPFVMLLPDVPAGSRSQSSDIFSVLRFSFDRRAIRFLIPVSAGLILAGILPLSSSSGQFFLSSGLTKSVRELGWAIEAGGMILTGFVYKWLVQKKHWSARVVLPLNGFALLLALVSQSAISVFFILAAISLSASLCFQIFRDDLLISAAAHQAETRTASAFSELVRSLLFSISPVLLSFFGARYGIDMIYGFIALQVALLLVWLSFRRTAN